LQSYIAVTRLVRLVTVHPIADWAGIICRLRSVDVNGMLKEEGLGGWSIGKLVNLVQVLIAPN